MLLQFWCLTGSAVSVTTPGFALVCSSNKEYVPECLKSQHRPISSQANGNIKDIHFNTD